MNISVAMASFNGEKYIEEQVLSIVCQLNDDDELIVSDDGSSDNTLRIVTKLSSLYPQIHLIEGPQKGVFKNFENAMLHCKNDIIFLSDQDDVWIKGKVEKVKDVFEKHPEINVVMHRAYVLNQDEKTTNLMVHYRKGFINNLIKSCYWGCCLAIRKKYIDQYLPFCVKGTAHDQLIGLLAEEDKCVYYEEEPLCYHRYHNNNQTFRKPLVKRISFRFKMLRDYMSCKYAHRKGNLNVQG